MLSVNSAIKSHQKFCFPNIAYCIVHIASVRWDRRKKDRQASRRD